MPDPTPDTMTPADVDPGVQGKSRPRRLDFAERAVLLRYLQSHPNDTAHAIAVKLGHSPHTVASYRGLIQSDVKSMTAAVMQTDVLPALEEWAAARTVSALKGDHRPSKEWLIAAQAIDPDTQRQNVSVGFQVVLAPSPGTPAYVNASAPSVVAVHTPASSVQAPPAAFTPAPDAPTDPRPTDQPTNAPVLTTQTPHGSAYIAPSTPDAVRTPLPRVDAATPTPPQPRLHPPTKRLRR